MPGDKSITHRALLLGAIADGGSRFAGPGIGADTRASAALIRALGVRHELSAAELVVHGRGVEALHGPADPLDCGNSGTTVRLGAGLLAGRPFHSVLTGDASLRKRPMDRVVAPLRAMGADIRARAGDTRPPIEIGPSSLRGAAFDLPVASAQVKSALMLAGLQARGATTIRQPACSRDHTERMLAGMGAAIESRGLDLTVHPANGLDPLEMTIPGDFSSAAFWITAAVLHPDAEIVIRNVGLNPTRTGLLDVLAAMGARIEIEITATEPEPIGDITARSSSLSGTEVGGDLIARLIDEVPLVALLGSRAAGATHVTDAQELALKESDRIASTASGLGALGAEVESTPDGFWIAGPFGTDGGAADAAGDHRIAMLLAVAGLTGAAPVSVHGAQAADVSYPSFWDDLEAISE